MPIIIELDTQAMFSKDGVYPTHGRRNDVGVHCHFCSKMSVHRIDSLKDFTPAQIVRARFSRYNCTCGQHRRHSAHLMSTVVNLVEK